MRLLGKLSLVATLLALAMPLMAGVVVNNPINGSTVTTPVNYTAAASTTTCAKGVASMGVYVDDKLIYVVDGTKLSVSLPVALGKHATVVEEWDHCGGASFTSLSITVVAPAPPPQASAPALSPASGTYTSAQLVALSDATPGATIYYTTNGSTPTPSSSKYSGAILVGASGSIEAIAVATDYSNSAVASASYIITPLAATPAFSVAAGTYTSAQSVTLSDATPGATIYYTTNGVAPTTSSARYSSAIPVAATETIAAIAVATGYSNSAVASAIYSMTSPAATPTFSAAPGAYTLAQSVTLSDATPGATIYFTTNGATPTTSSTRYSGSIPVTSTETIAAIAVATGYSNSAVASAIYSITSPAATPTFSLPAGTYTSAQSVTLSDATPGATIYYTTNGATPTTSSTRYSGAISVTAEETIEAIAVATGYSNSAVASANYTFKLTAATPTFFVPAGTYTSAQSVTLSDATRGATIYYTTNGAGPTTSSTLYSGPISVGASETIEAVAFASGYTNSGMARADYVIKPRSSGPPVPASAIAATELQLRPDWKYNHDPGTTGSSTGVMTVVADPSLSGQAAEFDNSYLDWGGEIYHLTFGSDTASTNFVYDAEIWIAEGSQIGNIEMDMNQVIDNGDTVLYGFQCDGDHGTWDYSGNKGTLGASNITWFHSTQPCKPADWTTNTWHHVQISYSRDEVGDITYNGVWLDGVEAVIDATVPSAGALGWAKGELITNFQIDGVGASGASVLYVDNLTISRW